MGRKRKRGVAVKQRHAPAALSQVKVPHYTLNVHLADPQNWFGLGGKDEDSRGVGPTCS